MSYWGWDMSSGDIFSNVLEQIVWKIDWTDGIMNPATQQNLSILKFSQQC